MAIMPPKVHEKRTGENMINFKQSPNRPREFKAYVLMTPEDRAKYNDREVNHIKIEVEYVMGGMNYFSGNSYKRGYRVNATPVLLSDGESGLRSESYTIMGDQRSCGGYVFIEEAPRFNARRLRELAELYDADVPAMAAAVIGNQITRLIELVRAKVSAHV